MDHEMMMLECLKLATAQGFKRDEARDEAQRMLNQILGRKTDGGLPHGNALKAKVVGRDGDLDPPFSDYVRKPE